MLIRTLVLSVGLLFAAAPTYAQTPEPPAAPSSVQHEETASALRELYQALFFDSGMFDTMIEHYLPQYSQTITTSEIYRVGGNRRRADLDALIARTPDIMRDEIIAEASAMSGNIAPRVSDLVTPEELRDFADLMRSPLWERHIQAAMARMAASNGQSIEDLGVEFTPEEEAQFNAMSERPAAQALMRTGPVLMAVIDAEFEAAAPRIQQRTQQRLARELCDLLGRDCPPALRATLRGT